MQSDKQTPNEGESQAPWEAPDRDAPHGNSSEAASLATQEASSATAPAQSKPSSDGQKKKSGPSLLESLRFLLPFIAVAFYLWSTSADTAKLALTETSKIGLVRIEGVILSSERIIKKLNNLNLDRDIKGFIIKVDSPGGSVGASQEIYDRVRQIAEMKPVFVSMENMAASGGYYASLGADKIYANPGTITGSIGVILQGFDASELMKNIGVKDITIKSGDKKDLLSAFRNPTEEELDIMQILINETYQQFVRAVSEARGLSHEQTELLADGRIYNGEQAMRSGLIDGLKNFNDVVFEMRAEIGDTGAEIYEGDTLEDNLYYLMHENLSGIFNLGARITRGPTLMAIMPGWF